MYSLGPIRFFTPYLSFIGRWSFRRRVVDNVPIKKFQTLLKITDKMSEMTKVVYEGKKAAFMAGDEAAQEQVGQGKDIMSILCEYLFVYLISANSPETYQ